MVSKYLTLAKLVEYMAAQHINKAREDHIPRVSVPATTDRVRVVVAHFVTSRLALNSHFRLNCQHKNYFRAVGRRISHLRQLCSTRGTYRFFIATTVAQLFYT